MASLPPSLRDTLAYFAKYNYPLTAEELWFWQHGTNYSKKFIERCALSTAGWQLRRQREQFSKKKWLIARQVGESLKRFPSIAAVYITGALAMNNCPADDDIDIMIITSPNALWVTRFFVVLYLKLLGIRRHPVSAFRQPITENRTCDNLWLDTSHLTIQPSSHNALYLAHEILQAKVLWDRASIHQQFLHSNSWVKNFLPVAYSQSLGQLEIRSIRSINPIFYVLNIIFFIPQYLYMLPKMSSEKVGLGFAFFHPTKPST